MTLIRMESLYYTQLPMLEMISMGLAWLFVLICIGSFSG